MTNFESNNRIYLGVFKRERVFFCNISKSLVKECGGVFSSPDFYFEDLWGRLVEIVYCNDSTYVVNLYNESERIQCVTVHSNEVTAAYIVEKNNTFYNRIEFSKWGGIDIGYDECVVGGDNTDKDNVFFHSDENTLFQHSDECEFIDFCCGKVLMIFERDNERALYRICTKTKEKSIIMYGVDSAKWIRSDLALIRTIKNGYLEYYLHNGVSVEKFDFDSYIEFGFRSKSDLNTTVFSDFHPPLVTTFLKHKEYVEEKKSDRNVDVIKCSENRYSSYYRRSSNQIDKIYISLHGGPESYEVDDGRYYGLYDKFLGDEAAVVCWNYPGSKLGDYKYQEYPWKNWDECILNRFGLLLEDVRSRFNCDNIVLIGFSFGANIAIYLSSMFSLNRAIAISPVASISIQADIDSDLTDWFKRRFRLDGSSTIEELHNITTVKCPVLIIHGNNDPVSKIINSIRFYDAVSAMDRSISVEIDDFGHSLNSKECASYRISKVFDFIS